MCTAVICCAGQAICCASVGCCKCLCCCCSKCGASERTFARIGYVFFSVIWAVISVLLMFYAPQILEPWKGFIHCPEESSSDEDQLVCFGISTIYRISFLLVVFHIVMLFFGICPKHQGIRTFHDGCWILKFFLIVVGFILTLFISNQFFQGYGYLSQVVSVLYLLYQVLALVSFAYLVNDKLVSAAGQGSRCASVSLILLTVIMYSSGITLSGFYFDWFGQCGTNLGLIISTLVAGVLAFVLVLLRTRQDASIFTTGVIFLYTVYIVWSAMGSRPDAQCNRFSVSDYNTVSQIVFGLFFAVLALLVTSAVTKSEESDSNGGGGLTEKISSGIREEKQDDEEQARSRDIETKNKEAVVAHEITKPTVLFHVIMVIASLYYAMLLTNWGNPSVNERTTDFFGVSWLSFWVKIVSQWITFILFFVSLLLPLCSKRQYQTI